MFSLDLKTMDRVVYRRENSSVQVKVGHDELAKIRFQLWIKECALWKLAVRDW
jgi:hypothetical protein